MFESIKEKIWEQLKEKNVSLVMLYDREGRILWHRGRSINGNTVSAGEGFSRSFIEAAFRKRCGPVEHEDVVIAPETGALTRSARVLRIKSLIIQPIGDQFFLYIDSGVKESFSETDRELFRIAGSLLGETIEQVRKNEGEAGGLSGSSREIQHVRDLVLRYSLEENPVLLLGETGVGKSRIAELIHRYSGKKGKFYTVNTPGIPENLFESEVFGHRRGAFTDARSDKTGFVDEAAGGTLFFDEISEIPLSFQARLLRFLETRKYHVLGEPAERDANVRILAATNRDLGEAIRARQFREDLYFRLQVLSIEIPPLRSRQEDIRALVMENLKLLRGKETGPGFWEAMNAHHWPGNTRELVTVLLRAGIDSSDEVNGEEIRRLIGQSRLPDVSPWKEEQLQEFEARLNAGEDFWQGVWQPFIRRDLNRDQVRRILERGYAGNQYSLKKLSKAWRIDDSEFKKFIAILHKYKINPKKKA
jgi:transcriptional regulator with PAS, ATPase and Fis domain